jgi:hypothetical protein
VPPISRSSQPSIGPRLVASHPRRETLRAGLRAFQVASVTKFSGRMVILLVILRPITRPPPGANFKNVRKNWRRRPDLNRGWRFCRPRQAHQNRPETANSLAFLPPGTARIRLNPPPKGSATGSAVFKACSIRSPTRPLRRAPDFGGFPPKATSTMALKVATLTRSTPRCQE